MATEFDIIRQYFRNVGPPRDDVVLDVGDDAAVVQLSSDEKLAMTLDLLLGGVHFPLQSPPERIGHKALAVNLSDLAAMGARPAWFTLGLALPENDRDWLKSFSQGLSRLASRYGIRLIGGDLTKGPLAIAINACGIVDRENFVCRTGAAAGDLILLSGSIGGAALGLESYSDPGQFSDDERERVRIRLEQPEPRVALGLRLPEIASAAIDVSDGLIQDLKHLLDGSDKGARIDVANLPLQVDYREHVARIGYERAVSFGDDYELLFTVAPENLAKARAIADECKTEISRIGVITTDRGLEITGPDGKLWSPASQGYDHFASSV